MTQTTREILAERLAEQLGVTPQSHKLSAFAEACFNDNSLGELIDGLNAKRADADDCESWEITPTQWRDGIRQAVEYALYCAIWDV